ncbi:protein FD isoform X2 [Dendrobium catenatum]|uniref:Protein FD n=1 Tax=Dendrobium catenatum TaxID=906689 RepID=A0A2I0XB03_9ASPA|nr:protein FD isoform X2 [Dendrobium catenatum]PKU85082.1 Protein FD [Dendrobium catenatum]
MWPTSPAADGNTNTNTNTNTKTRARLSSSSSSSSSLSTSSSFSRSSSSSSSVAVLQTPKRKTMEEVWKDMNLATLANESQPPAAVSGDTRHFFRGMILQDFLASAFKSPPSSAVSSEKPQLPLPPTALSLTSGLCGPFGPSNLPHHTAASSPFSLSTKKQNLEDAPSCNAESDRHHKRMMKNRESAARSRARKQAYTNELELEVAHRAEENAKLKKQNEELRVAMAAQIPKKDFLQRTSSAPF